MNYSNSSGQKSASTVISSNPGALVGVDVAPPNAGQATLIVYDSNSATTSGKTILSEIYVDAGLASVNHEYVNPVCVNEGIYCVLTGTTTYIIRYLVG